MEAMEIKRGPRVTVTIDRRINDGLVNELDQSGYLC